VSIILLLLFVAECVNKKMPKFSNKGKIIYYCISFYKNNNNLIIKMLIIFVAEYVNKKCRN
jgi:hypothetical protein